MSSLNGLNGTIFAFGEMVRMVLMYWFKKKVYKQTERFKKNRTTVSVAIMKGLTLKLLDTADICWHLNQPVSLFLSFFLSFVLFAYFEDSSVKRQEDVLQLWNDETVPQNKRGSKTLIGAGGNEASPKIFCQPSIFNRKLETKK